MVKNILSIIISAALLVAISTYEIFYLNFSFKSFGEELTALYAKTEEHTATAEDAEAVKISWDSKKTRLHIWVPHGDISYIDYWLNEAIGLIYVGDYDAALPKVVVLIEICEKVPSSYFPNAENIF